MPVPDGAIVKLYWAINGALALNVMGARVLSGTTFNQTLANTLGTAIKSAFSANLAASLSTSASLVRVGVRDLRADHLPEFRDVNAAIPGSATGDPLPASVAMCVTQRTGLAGKSFRGRTYLSGFAEGSNDATGSSASAAATASINFMAAVAAAMNSNGLKAAVVSRPAEHYTIVKTTFHADGSSTSDVLSDVSAKTGQVNDITAYESRLASWETQRRRINGRGPAPSTLAARVSADIS